MVDDKIGNRGSQRSLRNVYIAKAKSKLYMARWPRHVIIRKFWEMGMGIIPKIYKRSTLTIRGTPRFLLIGMVRFRIHGLFAYIVRSGSIRNNLFSLTVGRTLAFRQRHGATVDQSKWMKVFERENTMQNGNGESVCVGKGENVCVWNMKGISLKYQRH